jgi:hypothetical protein
MCKNKTNKILTIKVLKEDIKQGVNESIYFCPVARSMNRDYNKGREQGIIHVYADEVCLRKKIYKVSRGMSKFIKDFDNNQKVQPATFKLKEIK